MKSLVITNHDNTILRQVCETLQMSEYEYGLDHVGGIRCCESNESLIGIAILGRRPILRSELATKTRQALTENTIKRTKHIRARRNSSERLPNDVCEIFAVTKFS